MLTFAVGDLLGIYAYTTNNVQNMEVFHPSGGTQFDTGSAFQSYTVTNSSQSVFIGTNPSVTTPWNGDIVQIVAGNWRIFNTNNNQLPARRGLRFFPNWTVDSASEGSAVVSYVIAVDFQRGNIGDVLSPGDTILDRTGGTSCTVITGASPVVATGGSVLLP
jgi:hypothetical protein